MKHCSYVTVLELLLSTNINRYTTAIYFATTFVSITSYDMHGPKPHNLNLYIQKFDQRLLSWKNLQPSGSVKYTGLSSSPMFAEAKDLNDSIDEREEAVSSESETISSCMIIWSSSISDVSDPDVPNKSLLMAVLAVSTNHSSSGSALHRRKLAKSVASKNSNTSWK